MTRPQNNSPQLVSWATRSWRSAKGLFWGAAAVGVGVYVLSWNEARAVLEARGMAQGVAELVTIQPDQIDSRNEKRLVHLIGPATCDETLSDPQLGVSAKAIRLARRVEMYQWQELAEERRRTQADGSSTTDMTYRYQPIWSEPLIDSRRFHTEQARTDHRNPDRLPFEAWNRVGETVRVGRFTLSTRLVEQIQASASLALGEGDLDRLPADLRPRARLFNGQLCLSDDPASPRIGDVRFEYRVVPPTTVSVIARQCGSALDGYSTSSAGTVELLRVGQHEAREMFSAATTRNNAWSWMARGASLTLLWLGCGGVTRTLTGLLMMIPFVSDMLHAGRRVFATGLTVSVAIVTATAWWMTLHPFVCGLLWGLATATLYAIWRWGRRRRRAAAAA